MFVKLPDCNKEFLLSLLVGKGDQEGWVEIGEWVTRLLSNKATEFQSEPCLQGVVDYQ